jgi:hypothetical protein
LELREDTFSPAAIVVFSGAGHDTQVRGSRIVIYNGAAVSLLELASPFMTGAARASTIGGYADNDNVTGP